MLAFPFKRRGGGGANGATDVASVLLGSMARGVLDSDLVVGSCTLGG